jgi:hypothetical protein
MNAVAIGENPKGSERLPEAGYSLLQSVSPPTRPAYASALPCQQLNSEASASEGRRGRNVRLLTPDG